MGKNKHIKISELPAVLAQLNAHALEYDFFGIHSSGFDCIYFALDGLFISIEYEVLTEEQKPWYSKLETFAQEQGYKVSKTTYHNQPLYMSSEPAPVLKLQIQGNEEKAAHIGYLIMTEVFGNPKDTIYEVVP